jgi:acyl dehydratase
VEAEVLDVIPSRSRPDRGIVKLQATTLNQHDEIVQVSIGSIIVPRRQR